MGSFFSSPAADDAASDDRSSLPGKRLSAAQKQHEHDLQVFAYMFAVHALLCYNLKNPDAEYEFVKDSTKVSKVACVGFRQNFWYHVGFWARLVDDGDATTDQLQEQYFFAEMRYDRSKRLVTETCTILEMPLCRFKSGCAFCPDKFEILHPRDTELFICGKKRQKNKFFRETCMLTKPFNSRCAER